MAFMRYQLTRSLLAARRTHSPSCICRHLLLYWHARDITHSGMHCRSQSIALGMPTHSCALMLRVIAGMSNKPDRKICLSCGNYINSPLNCAPLKLRASVIKRKVHRSMLMLVERLFSRKWMAAADPSAVEGSPSALQISHPQNGHIP